uniref:Cerato-platanin-like protein 2 n=1 Tax=Ganoderma boninense TaxID=34458 RepID=A0A5K1JTY5_9APHY|nr:Cerato-platanin-like protein 2 [Ganoderma boninense]
MRRARSRSRAQFTGEAPIGPPGIRERFARLFGRRGGWIRASGTDGDEWDPSDPLPYHASELRQGDHRGYPSMVSNPSWTSKDPRQNVGPRASTGSVDVELRAPSPDSVLSTAFQHDLLPSEDSVEAVSAPAKPMGVGGGFENGRAGAPRDERHFSVQMASQESGSISLGSMRKFDNGTKFRESI